MLPTTMHDIEHALDEFIGHELGEQVGHGADEHAHRFPRAQRRDEHLLIEVDLDLVPGLAVVIETRAPRRKSAAVHCAGIAVTADRRDALTVKSPGAGPDDL